MTLMIRRAIAMAVLAIVMAATSGCTKSAIPQATGKGAIRGLNAIATAPDINFAIEELLLGSIGFKEVTVFNAYDDLSYDFNFDLFLPGEFEPDRIAVRFIDVVADTEYTVALVGTVANPSTVLWEDPVREWDGSETVFELFFAHLGSAVATLDVYFAAPGTTPVLGQAVGTLSFGERLPLQEFAESSDGYELILTAANDPATVVYQSNPVGPLARTRNVMAIFDADPTVPGNVGVNLITGTGGSVAIADVNFPSQLRTLHGALGTANYDGYFDGDFANLIYPDIGYLELSPYEDFPGTEALLTLTAVGNSGATIHESDLPVAPASRRTVVLAGQPGSLSFVSLPDNGRPLETFPQVRILNVAFNAELIDIYVLEPGTPLEDAILPRFAGLPPLGTTNFTEVSAGMREFTVTLRGEQTAIATPVVLDLANGDAVDMILVDTVDPAVLELVVFDP